MLQLYFTFTLSSQFTFLIFTDTHTHNLKPNSSHRPLWLHTHTLLQIQVLQLIPASPIFWTALLIVRPRNLPLSPQSPSTQRDALFLLTPTPPGCSRRRVSMVTLLQNVKVFFGLFVLSDEAAIHTCTPADTQPAGYSVQHHWHSCHWLQLCESVCVESK